MDDIDEVYFQSCLKKETAFFLDIVIEMSFFISLELMTIP
jgi:hypothetical protein